MGACLIVDHCVILTLENIIRGVFLASVATRSHIHCIKKKMGVLVVSANV